MAASGRSLNTGEARLVQEFITEALAVGARPMPDIRGFGQRMDIRHGGSEDSTTGVKSYGRSVWLNQRLLSYRCENSRVAHHLICTLARWRGTGGESPVIRPFPFLPEQLIREACAATSIQALWRAHHTRCSLSVSLRGAAALRRSVLCIQRCW